MCMPTTVTLYAIFTVYTQKVAANGHKTPSVSQNNIHKYTCTNTTLVCLPLGTTVNGETSDSVDKIVTVMIPNPTDQRVQDFE